MLSRDLNGQCSLEHEENIGICVGNTVTNPIQFCINVSDDLKSEVYGCYVYESKSVERITREGIKGFFMQIEKAESPNNRWRPDILCQIMDNVFDYIEYLEANQKDK